MKKINLKEVSKLIPKKTKSSNKNDYGHTLIIGGAKKYIGAGILASLAATRTGAGYTHLMSDLIKYDYLTYPDFIVTNFSTKYLSDKKHYSIGIGPGLGLDSNKKKILNYLIANDFQKVIVDADALTILSKMKVKKLPENWILTPHEGEMSRLISKNIKWVKSNRVEAITLAQSKYGCHVLLKGFDSLLMNSKKDLIVSSIGKSSLAKAGSGDVLTGILAALLGMGLDSFESMKLGVSIHSLAAHEFEKKHDELSLRPVDLANLISLVLKKLRKLTEL